MADEIGKYAREDAPARTADDERERLGKRIQIFRINRGLTQEELARRSGLTVKTLYHIETGAPARASSLAKVCEGLETSVEAMTASMAMQYSPELPYLLHRQTDSTWRAPIDRRRSPPADNAERLRDPAERRRLGHLGLVPYFKNNPQIVMPEGPGTVFIELHGRHEGDINAPVFRDAKILCLEGAARLLIREEAVELGPGDMVGYHSADLRWAEPAHPLRPGEPPALILWIGASRIGKAVKEDGRTVVRRASKPA